jgi:hypothetical protein
MRSSLSEVFTEKLGRKREIEDDALRSVCVFAGVHQALQQDQQESVIDGSNIR